MIRKQIKNILSQTRSRTLKITVLILLSTFLVSLAISFIALGINNEVNYYIHYDEKSDLDYKVYLKENEYFGKYLGKDRQYIASLIDYIEANFKYNLSIDEKIDYSYYYYIEAETLVLDYNDKILYQKKDIIIPKKEFNDLKDYSFGINEIVKLDYNYYNSIVNTFISRYNLTNTKNAINLKMYVGINGNCKEYTASLKDNAVISMVIPLSKNTVNVDMKYKLNSGTNKLLECKKTSLWENHYLIIGGSFSFFAVIIIIYLIIYIISTRSVITIYNRILKNIFNNYGRYISKIKTELKYEKFQIVLVEQFEDLFEIRNASNSPILFSQNESKTKSAFVVPTNTALVYVYYFSIDELKRKLDIK